jgi:xanthine dehydrogenase YagR molybdenum-binding subunit
MDTAHSMVGRARPRLEGPAKVAGTARYAMEYPLDGVTYGWPVVSPVAKAVIVEVDDSGASALPGVLAVLWHDNAPRLSPDADPDLRLLQGNEVWYRGQVVAVVVAESLEVARDAARLVRVSYRGGPGDTLLTADHPALYRPEKVNAGYETDVDSGDFDGAFAASPVRVDEVYSTPAQHNSPLEPHAATAVWVDGRLTVYDASQGTTVVARTLAALFELPTDAVRVVAEHIGGGFGGKAFTRCPAVLAALAARQVGRPVRLALTRQQTFGPVGYRTPTIQRVRLGADLDGRLRCAGHDSITQTSTIKEFAEQAATYSRWMYAAPNRHSGHRLARLDVPTPSIMRAPGETPGSFALECAMDELAVACRVDPVELRIRNEPDLDPTENLPFSSRNLVACLREGARRFGWDDRDPTPGVRRDGRWLTGTGVAGCSYPARTGPCGASARAEPDGSYHVAINATDIGTGARTALWQIAVDELDAPPERVTVHIGDSGLPPAIAAGGSMGTSSWGWAVTKACRELCARIRAAGGTVPSDGLAVTVDTAEDVAARRNLARYAFGAQFAQARVDADTGEVRVTRLLGVFAAGRIVNATTARSQFIGGMTMGLSMALHEEALLDPAIGGWLNRDFAQYHFATHADVEHIEAYWVDEPDDDLNPMGTKGIGEIGIVGTAAAVANAVHHATGVRVRDLPVRLDKVLSGLDRAAGAP